MAKRKVPIKQSALVSRFGVRLRLIRSSRGMTQAELAGLAKITASYVYRLENSLVSPGIDLIERLADSLGTKVSDLLPEIESGDAFPLLQDRAQNLFSQLMKQATREDLLMLCPLLARLVESPTRKR